MSPGAALYLASPEDIGPALAPVAGRPLAFRVVRAAVRAGCRRVYLPALFRGGAVEDAMATSPAVRAAVVWLEAGLAPPAGPLLLLPAAALVSDDALRSLLARGPIAVLAASLDGSAPIAIADPVSAGTWWTALLAARPLGDTLMRTLKGDPRAALVAAGWCVRVTSNRSRAEAEARLEAELGSPIDTRVDVLFHRRLSRPLSQLAVRWEITPNQITLLSLAVGLAAAWCFWQATPGRALAGLALYALAVVLDHADGEVARLTLSESSFGARLDVAVDTLIHALLVAAMGVTAQRVAGGGAAIFGLIAALGVVGSALTTRAAHPASGGIGRILDALGNRDGFYALLAVFIVGLAVWPAALPVLSIVVAAGCHAFWIGRVTYGVRRDRRANTERKPK